MHIPEVPAFRKQRQRVAHPKPAWAGSKNLSSKTAKTKPPMGKLTFRVSLVRRVTLLYFFADFFNVWLKRIQLSSKTCVCI